MATGFTIVSWNAGAVLAATAAGVERGMEAAVAMLAAEAAQMVSVAGGGQPSAPGQPPALQSGTLHASIASEVQTARDGIHGFFGVRENVAYALRLELGFVGVDSLGRHYDQAPRPFLRPTLFNNWTRVISLIASESNSPA
jgi:hypothetical protein